MILLGLIVVVVLAVFVTGVFNLMRGGTTRVTAGALLVLVAAGTTMWMLANFTT